MIVQTANAISRLTDINLSNLVIRLAQEVQSTE